ncbi:hypothetical protein GGR52DRAFT_555154 [Hypoxylon sp. FL1284]|nr:hypothetical protein GGR52DRAFT_555154 [Hypoxylon sp. FL1284]
MSADTNLNDSENEYSNYLPIKASALPTPELTDEGKDLPVYPPSAPIPKGFIGAIARTIQGAPPCVWVVNQHTEDITVVVSKYQPNRLFTGGDLNVSLTGGGIGFSTTTYLGPATQKTLAPQSRDEERSVGAFPLWTRRHDFGVISIFTGPDKILYIENDRIPAGCTAFFRNKPDLVFLAYNKAADST